MAPYFIMARTHLRHPSDTYEVFRDRFICCKYHDENGNANQTTRVKIYWHTFHVTTLVILVNALQFLTCMMNNNKCSIECPFCAGNFTGCPCGYPQCYTCRADTKEDCTAIQSLETCDGYDVIIDILSFFLYLITLIWFCPHL